MDKKVSILLNVVNVEKIIEKSILSVLAQTYTNFELIICANGCTDNTIVIIGKMISEHSTNHKMHFTTLPFVNKFHALNWILLLATGDFIVIKEVDDIWQPKRLEQQIKEFHSFDEAKCLIKQKIAEEHKMPMALSLETQSLF